MTGDTEGARRAGAPMPNRAPGDTEGARRAGAGMPNRAPGGTERRAIHPGLRVRIVQKQHQPTGELTEGVVADILTNSPHHPHGIKVRLQSGEVGRVKEIIE